MKAKLLGKKRQSREDEEEDREIEDLKQTKEEKEEKLNNKIDNEEAPKEKESLFGNSAPKNGGLFGNLSENKSNNKPTLFNQGESNKFHNSSLFGGASLFGSGGSSSLFGSSTASSSLFASKSPFNTIANDNQKFLTTDEKSKEKEDKSDNENDDDNELFQSNSPNPYNPIDDQAKEQPKENNPYTKKYIKEIENIYEYSKENNKFSSKGKGFLSIEFAEIEDKKIGVIVFRNTVGNKIVEGILAKNIKKFEKYVKNFKHVASFSFLTKGSSGKLEIGFCKVPFIRDNDLQDFEKAYNEVIDSLDTPTEGKDTKSEVKVNTEEKTKEEK